MVSSTSGGQHYLIFLSLALPKELTAVPNTMQKSHGKKCPLNLVGRSPVTTLKQVPMGVVSIEADCSEPNTALDIRKRTWAFNYLL